MSSLVWFSWRLLTLKCDQRILRQCASDRCDLQYTRVHAFWHKHFQLPFVCLGLGDLWRVGVAGQALERLNAAKGAVDLVVQI